jgi:hypothetical protein
MGIPQEQDQQQDQEQEQDQDCVCIAPVPEVVQPRDKNADTEAVVQAWREAFDAPNYRPDTWDTIAIGDAFAGNWSAELLCESVRGWAMDPWKDRRHHCAIPKLLKDSAAIQKGIALGDDAASPETDGGAPEVSEMEKAGQRPMWAEILDDDPTAPVPDWYREERGG